MTLKNVKFMVSAPNKEHYPSSSLNEIVILGRSNVGKSTFINSLCGNKNMAKTSSTPGRTRLLNFFNVNNDFVLVDAPGYGYNAASKKLDRLFYDMMDEYFEIRSNLKGAILLVDSRREPSDDDKEMLEVLSGYNIPTLIVATKVDKLNQSQRSLLDKNIIKKFQLDDDAMIIRSTSMNTKWIDEAVEVIYEIAKNY
ncbi:MAG: ribosome biogenesis GTP-binding protein YihA/YsxC [Bacilli bacterium]|nr:ribosome biogenesis GTP-binding protein YihA/YsxC [Bacilli bacterium]